MTELNQNVMVRINGKMFRCPDCSCNVFHERFRTERKIYYGCNGCGSMWIGEKTCTENLPIQQS